MNYANLSLEVTTGVAVVMVDRPKKLNALDRETVDSLGRCFDDLASDSNVGSVILTGAGDKAFVAGADIEELRDLSPAQGRDLCLQGHAVLAKIEKLPKPVIAAINGYALGGGLELAMACHIRLAAPNARLGQPEVRLGAIPGYGGTQRLPRLVGKSVALEMLLTGDPITAGEAQRVGLVNRVVPAEELLPEARRVAAKILENGPVAVALCLEAVHRGLQMPIEEALAWEAAQFGLSCATQDFREGTRAFLDKRKPRFQGR